MTNATIRWSLLLIGVGIGFLIGYWLDRSFRYGASGLLLHAVHLWRFGLGFGILH